MNLTEFAVATLSIVVTAGYIIALLLRVGLLRALALAAAVYMIGGGLAGLVVAAAAVIA